MFAPTIGQIVAHFVGDYLLQSQWMASEKVRNSIAAAFHAFVYTLSFLFLTRSILALAIIGGTHFAIDRWRLARYIVWARNFLAPWPWWYTWKEAKNNNGAGENVPPFMSAWLLIIVDNMMHIAINASALAYFA